MPHGVGLFRVFTGPGRLRIAIKGPESHAKSLTRHERVPVPEMALDVSDLTLGV